MSNYQLNAGDSVVVSIADTDNVTGAAVVTDAGSVTAVLSNYSDTVVVDPSGLFATVTAGTTTGTGNTVTVNAKVNGVASASVVGTYDVVAATTPSDATTLSVSFGTETGPTGTSAPLTAAQVAALVAAGSPFTAYPLTAAQYSALAAAGFPVAGYPTSADPLPGTAGSSQTLDVNGNFIATSGG